MSDSSIWPRNTAAEWREWVRWCEDEPNTAEKWAHIFAENSRDVQEFRAFQERRRAERKFFEGEYVSTLAEHPAASLIEEELAERGWSLDRLAVEMGGDSPEERIIDRVALDFLLACRGEQVIRIGEQTAEKLSRAFGTGPQFWRNLDAQWAKEQA